ncbi:hypothetical protein [Streptomyces sp. NE06-03C]|uniref:hypothetical protein n=1 Tax=Streptomyces sp. NE06-03C TaxID=3028694 RepID=UPI0029BC7EFC|nr:hypothetical protein [Streptomyces sp. NE06-03C]MDX2917292.1 hypothetical protein [Streptomyces sp. NE06-03C]
MTDNTRRTRRSSSSPRTTSPRPSNDPFIDPSPSTSSTWSSSSDSSTSNCDTSSSSSSSSCGE